MSEHGPNGRSELALAFRLSDVKLTYFQYGLGSPRPIKGAPAPIPLQAAARSRALVARLSVAGLGLASRAPALRRPIAFDDLG